jgi:hypothetical protein
MGFTPQQVNAMSPWQWAAVYEGYFDAHASPEDRASVMMSDAEFDAAARMLET